MKILLLEDDFALASEISRFFRDNQAQCDVVYDGSLVQKQLQREDYQLVLLDVNVPGMNGLEVCSRIRTSDRRIPVLMLTAYGEVEDKLEAFRMGADDYLVKPFHFAELLARVNALLRRSGQSQPGSRQIQIDDLEIDSGSMTATRGGKALNLTPKEFRLLQILAEAGGRVLSKRQIADRLWEDHIQTNPNTIEVYINFLRSKIDRDAARKLIHTRVGFGYYLKAE